MIGLHHLRPLPIASRPHQNVAHLHARVPAYYRRAQLAPSARCVALDHHTGAHARIWHCVQCAARTPGQGRAEAADPPHKSSKQVKAAEKLYVDFVRFSRFDTSATRDMLEDA